MKLTRKIAAAIMSLCLVSSISVTSFAESGTNTVAFVDNSLMENDTADFPIIDVTDNEEVSPAMMMYQVTYNANGGTGSPSTQYKAEDYPVYISATVPTRENYIFCGWATSKNATTPQYFPHDQYNIDRTLSLYAVWKPFNYNDGSTYTGSFSYPLYGGTEWGEDIGSSVECDAFARLAYYTVNDYYVPSYDVLPDESATLTEDNLYSYLQEFGVNSFVRGETPNGTEHSVYIVTYDLSTVTIYDANYTADTVAYQRLSYSDFLGRITYLLRYFSHV